MIWIRRGYGAFVRCKNEAKARSLAAHWQRTGQGGSDHPVIGMFESSNPDALLKGQYQRYVVLYGESHAQPA